MISYDRQAGGSRPLPACPTPPEQQLTPLDTALSVSGLRKSYGDRQVLKGVDFAVAPGELVVLLGANGSGKSTALRCVVGLAEADAGEIRLAGRRLRGLGGAELAKARRAAAMVFQQIHLVRRRSALDNVCAGGLAGLPLSRSLAPAFFPRELRERAMACLQRVGLADRAHDRAGSLSGGQQQRVAVARALCQGAEVLLADEPVSALDPAAATQVMALLAELARRDGLAVAAVLHQPDLAREHADRVIGLVDGEIRLSCHASALSESDIDALYQSEDS
ncbi:ATP-binding cassette domain-containing protein [Actinokineospora auranticolor]|uniref:Phosphonate transport system ATP-binding protein n=1 Tax=Actinokineospora auranticolor TaxID=155976 RepID=A0A2S6GKS7_9PSEU|nr:ATP-binding cassette domain-containing protein [Actinokineospora auranticolor]PPK65746.1 phosphonate transport system ATP-binding protein [Actinokineospora auranticolor]